MPLIKGEKDSLQKALDSADYKDVFPGIPNSSFANKVEELLLINTPEDIFEFINEKLILGTQEEKNKLETFMEKECPLLFNEFKDNSLKKNFLLSMLHAGEPAIFEIISRIYNPDLMKKIDTTAKVKISGADQNIKDIKNLYQFKFLIRNNFKSPDDISNTVIGQSLGLLTNEGDVNYFLKRLAEKRPNASLKQEIDDFSYVVNSLGKFDNSVKEIVRKQLPKVFREKLKHFDNTDMNYSPIYEFLECVPNIFDPTNPEDVKQFKRCFKAIIEHITAYDIPDFLSFLSNNNNKESIKLLESCLSFADILNNKFSKTDDDDTNTLLIDTLRRSIEYFFVAKNNILIQTGNEGTDEQKRIENLIEQMQEQPDLFKNETDLGDIKNFLITHLDNQNTAFELCTQTITLPLPLPQSPMITPIIAFPDPLRAEKKDVMLCWLKNDVMKFDNIVCIPKETYKFATVGKDGTRIDFRIYNRNNNKMQKASFEAKLICDSTKKSQCKEIPKEILKMYLKGNNEEKQKIKQTLIGGTAIQHYEGNLKITNIFPWLKDFAKLVNNPTLMYKYLIENIELDNNEQQKIKEEIKSSNPTDDDLFNKVKDGWASKIEYDTNVQKAEENLKKIDVIIKTVQLDYQKEDNNNDAFQSISYTTTHKLLKSKAVLEQAKNEIKDFRFNTLKNPTGCFIKQKEFDVAINDINITLNYIREKIDENIKQKFAKLEVKIANNKIKDETRVKKQLQNIETAKNSIQKLLDEDKDGERLQSIVENYRALINSIDNFDFTPKQNKFNGNSVKEKLKNQLQIEQESIDKQINKIANDGTLNEEQKENLIGQVRNVEQTLLNNYSNVFKASKDINSFGSQKQIESLMTQTNNIKEKELKKIKLLTKQEKESEKSNIISDQSLNDIQNLRDIIDRVNAENQQTLQQQQNKKEVILTDDANKYAKNIKNPEDVGWFYDTTNQALGFISPVIAAGTIVGAIFIPVATIPIAIVGGVLSILGFSTFVYRRSEKNREIKLERFEEKIKIQEDALKDKTPYSNESKNINNSTNNNLNIQNSTQNTASTPA